MGKHRLSNYKGKATPLVCKSKKWVYPAMPSFDYYSYFYRLLDVPNSYVNRKGSLVCVNVTESGLEFLDPVGLVHYYLRTNADGTAFELVAGGPGGAGPITQDPATFALWRTDQDLPGNTPGNLSIDLQYSRSNVAYIANALYSAILSGYDNLNNCVKSVICGGSNNTLGSAFIDDITESNSGRSFIGGGYGNNIGSNNHDCVIVGGIGNSIDRSNGSNQSVGCTIGGGNTNVMIPVSGAGNYLSNHTISGGCQNSITGFLYNTIGGGYQNTINVGAYGGNNLCAGATIGGGEANAVNYYGEYACIPGGRLNTAGRYSFACGYKASALLYSFCFSDGTPTTSTRSKQFVIGADGGLTLRNNAGTFDWYSTGGKWLSTPNAGCYLGADGVWYSASSRDLKFNFEDIDEFDILEKIRCIDVKSWEYKATPGVRHIGVTSEEFYDTFRIGNSGPGVNSLDLVGVLYKAFQGLIQEVDKLKFEIEKLKGSE